MKKIKVAEIITRMDWAGSPDIIRIICDSLTGDKYDVKLVIGQTRHPSAGTKEFLAKFKDNVIVIPFLRREINPFFDILAFFYLYRILTREKFDIVHTHTAKAGALGRLAARLAGNCRVVHMPHGHNFYGYFNPVGSKLVVLIERFLSRVTDKIVTLSELEKKDMVKFGVAKEGKIRTMLPGIALEFRNIGSGRNSSKKKEFGYGIDQKIVGMVSRLEPVKGPEYFIEAAAKVAKRIDNVRFLVVGEGSLRKRLESRAEEKGIGGKIVFAGWRDDALDIISFLEILVQPSLNEAIGRVLIEAQGLGIPVIATKVGGIPAVVRDNVTGILVPAGDTEKLTAAICDLLENTEKRLSMSAKSREWIDEKFSSETMASRIDSLYTEMVSK
ncbi:MAG: glycosyltransferase family 4 protein [Candidatus Omnitrophica bacterium]|nr:glycosyltransferase family 4 protein [Candidatus Omnitrophota bacterium]